METTDPLVNLNDALQNNLTLDEGDALLEDDTVQKSIQIDMKVETPEVNIEANIRYKYDI